MAKDEPSDGERTHLESAQTPQGAPTRITISATDPTIELVAPRHPEGKQSPNRSPSIEPTSPEGEPEAARDPSGDRDHDQRSQGLMNREPGRDEDRGQTQRDQKAQLRANHDREPRRDEDRRGDQEHRMHHQGQHSMMSLLITAGVALIFGLIGAIGYSYFFGSKSDESSSSHSGKDAGSQQESGSKGSSGGDSKGELPQKASTERSGSSAMARSVASGDGDSLKEQLVKLNHRIDGLGKRADRLQELLSLAVPLLQRIAPQTSGQ